MNVEDRISPEQQLRLNKMIATLNLDNPTAEYVAKHYPPGCLSEHVKDEHLRYYLLSSALYYKEYVLKSMIR